MDSKMWCLNQYYSALQGMKRIMEVVLKEYKDTETKTHIIGVQTRMNKFNYFFGVKLAILLLRHSDNLSKTLQSPKRSASQDHSSKNCYHLRKLRDDDYFLLF